MRTLTLALLTLATLTGAPGCTNNATFDMKINAPARPAGFEHLHMVVAARRQNDFYLGWNGADLPEPFELSDSPSPYNFSLVTENFSEDTFIKISFCILPSCAALANGERPADPQAEIWVSLEHPFYLAELTTLEFTIDEIPECVTSTCDTTTAPPVTLGSDCVNVPRPPVPSGVSELTYPVWSCQVERCDILCASTEGDAPGGSCAEGRDRGVSGRGGPHFCDSQ